MSQNTVHKYIKGDRIRIKQVRPYRGAEPISTDSEVLGTVTGFYTFSSFDLLARSDYKFSAGDHKYGTVDLAYHHSDIELINKRIVLK